MAEEKANVVVEAVSKELVFALLKRDSKEKQGLCVCTIVMSNTKSDTLPADF